MPRLIPPALGNGWRPDSPRHSEGGPNDSVPILDVVGDTHEMVGAVHDAALDPDNDETRLLAGHVVLLDKPGDQVSVRIGGSTLHEAATEVITAMTNLTTEMPAWVASTYPPLAEVVAEHFSVPGYSSCEVIELEEVPS